MARSHGTDLSGFGLTPEDLRALGYKVGAGKGPGDDGSGPDGPGRPAPRRRAPTDRALVLGGVTLAFLLLAVWGSSAARTLPRPEPAVADAAAFSSARAMAQLVEVSGRPATIGSPRHEAVLTRLLGRLEGLGLTPEVQLETVVAPPTPDGLVVAATVRNVVARIPGVESTGAVVLVAHYDGTPHSPGASDPGLGVGTVLETASALVAGPPARNDVIVLLSDGESAARAGARAFGERHPWASDVAVTLTVGGRGATGPAAVSWSGLDGERLVEALVAAGVRPVTGTAPLALASPASVDGAVAGERWVSVRTLGPAALYRHPLDTPERVSERSLQHAGASVLALVRVLGGADMSGATPAPDVVVLTFPFVGGVSYARGFVIAVSFALVVAFALVGLLLRYRRATRNGVLAGLAVGCASLGLAWAAGAGLGDLVAGLHQESDAVVGGVYRSGPHLAALAASAFAIVTGGLAAARRRFRLDEVAFGALAVPLVLCLVVTFSDPWAAPSVQWAFVPALLSAALVVALGPTRGTGTGAWVPVIVLGTLVVALAVPSLELIAAERTFAAAPTLAAAFAATLLLLVTALDWVVRRRPWLAPALGLVTAAALVGFALPSSGGEAGHPVPTTLLYLADEPVSGRIPVAVRAQQPEPDTAVGGPRLMTGKWLTVPGPGERWARSWVGQPLPGSRDPGLLMLAGQDRYEIAGSGPESELTPPTVEVVSASEAAGRRALDVVVRSGLGGEMTGIYLPDGDADVLSVAGVALGGPAPRLAHWGRSSGDGLAVTLALDPAASRVRVGVIEHHARPPELLGDFFFQRADSLIPNTALDSDRVVQRTLLTLEVPGPTEGGPEGS